MFASLIADSLLKEDDINDFIKNGFNENMPVNVLQHGDILAQLLEKKNAASKEVIDIIRYHHEMPDGRGYPFHIGFKQVSALTAVFIVSQYFVDRVYANILNDKENTEEEINSIISIVMEKFHQGKFKKVSE